MLAQEVRNARAAGFPIVMIHSTPDNEDGCEFGDLFGTTPNDLIQDGLFKALALANYPGVFQHVSACLVARALGAADLSSAAIKRRVSSSSMRKVLVRRAVPQAEAKADAAPSSSTSV